MKKSILTKLLILFFIVGIIPLTAIAIYSYTKGREALLINVRYDIEADAKDIALNISHLFNKAKSDILLLTINPAFKRYFLEPDKKSFWLKELNKAFLYLSKIFPDSFDEGCYILSNGREVCRVTFDKLASPAELSMDETRNAFFAPTFAIPEGEVYQQGPIQEGRFRNYMEHEKDIASSISIPLEARDGLIGVVCVTNKNAHSYEDDDMRRLMLIAGNLSIAVENAHLFERIRVANLETMMALAQALETKDAYTRGHSERMVQWSETVAKRLGLSGENVEIVKYAAILHDIGKIGIPDSILNKPGKLTDEEYRLVKEHPARGAEIVKQVKALEPVASIILQRQERWDGKGYPQGLKGEEILREARIIAVLDTFDAMISDRPYRKALSVEVAIEELKRCAGTQFDSQVADAFLAELRQGQRG